MEILSPKDMIKENLKNNDINTRHLMVITDHLESSLILV